MQLKNILTRISTIIAPLALALAVATASSTCFFLSYQPEEPACLKGMRLAGVK